MGRKFTTILQRKFTLKSKMTATIITTTMKMEGKLTIIQNSKFTILQRKFTITAMEDVRKSF